MKRKPQTQPTLASLTDAEKDQLADWLRKGEYDDVLERIKKPRAEGGFDLHFSRKPLQTFYAKVALLDLINARVSEDKKMTIAQFESLAAGEILLASSAENEKCKMLNTQCSMKEPGSSTNPAIHSSTNPADSGTRVSADVHDAIMNTTYDLATSGDNSPTDLLALQRLADFPARAEYRTHKIGLDLRKEAHNLEKHSHKIEMDQERAAQKKEMDDHRKRMSEERLTLAKKSLELREAQLAARAANSNSALSTPNSALSDALGPLATTLDDIEARTIQKFGDNTLKIPQSTPDTPSETPPALHSSSNGGPDSPALGVPPLGGQPVAPESDLINTGFQSGDSAAPNPTTASAVSPSSPVEIPNFQFSICPSNREAIVNAGETNPRRGWEPHSQSVPSVEPVSHQSTNPPIHSSAALTARVNAYTLARFHEALHGKDRLKVGKSAARRFKTKLQHCPCGQQHPCPTHGTFPRYFWELLSDSWDFKECLERNRLPYTSPLILIRAQERAQRERNRPPLPAPRSLLRASVSHSLRRHRSHISRPPGAPFPDESWTQECPCGASLPCPHHDDLWSEVRYMKPWNPDYISALKRNNIPVYTPSPDELHPLGKKALLLPKICASSSETSSETSPVLRSLDERGSISSHGVPHSCGQSAEHEPSLIITGFQSGDSAVPTETTASRTPSPLPQICNSHFAIFNLQSPPCAPESLSSPPIHSSMNPSIQPVLSDRSSRREETLDNDTNLETEFKPPSATAAPDNRNPGSEGSADFQAEGPET